MRGLLAVFAGAAPLVGPAAAQPVFPVLDTGAVPFVEQAGRAAYARFLTSNLPRAMAVASNGRFGWFGGSGTLAEARIRALESCKEKGGGDCATYAEDLNVVWRGRPLQAPPVPGPLSGDMSYEFAPDGRYLWRGPQGAVGAYVWAHGKGGPNGSYDARGRQPQPHVRWFNNAGYDVIRFDRHWASDDRDRAAGWLREGLAELRRQGYRKVIVAGQSRGAWNSLQVLDTPGLADAVIAVSPAAHGFGASPNMTAQSDDLRRVLTAARPQAARVALVQFEQDVFIGDADRRREQFERLLRPKIGALLLIDRPKDFTGHGAGAEPAFSQAFGACLLRFATAPLPAPAC